MELGVETPGALDVGTKEILVARCDISALMNLGFIESKTYDEISVGDTASTEHVLTTEDAMAFASISGFHSVLNSDELIERAGGIPPTGPNMWCASLISGLFSMNIPGPGCTLTNISLSFHNRIRVGDRILVKVQVTAKDDSTKIVTFDCEASNGAGTPIFPALPQLLAPCGKTALVHAARAAAHCE
jgi:phosphate acetyltransferase